MNKGKIIIIECISSGVNYIDDIIAAGYEPIVMEPYAPLYMRSYMRRFHDVELKEMRGEEAEQPVIIMAKPTYEATLKQVRAIGPAVILPGSDRGIEYATRLAHDLGLVGNDPENLSKMRNKYICQQALKQAGIRAIESRMVQTYEEALTFFEQMQQKGKGVVVKPVSGISSLGVYICKTQQELKAAFQRQKNNFIYKMYNGKDGKVLLQECIEGEEYIVNSVSCNGQHKITFITKYTKQIIPDKGKIYDCEISLLPQQTEVPALCDYQLKVLDAIGIRYGAVHSEIMIDRDGPVLIEANCRLCGGNKKSSLFSEAIGVSESELSLRSYLEADLFKETPQVILGNEMGKILVTKDLRLWQSVFIKKHYLRETLTQLPGFRTVFIRKEKGFFSQTVNLSTDLAIANFICQNSRQVETLMDTLHDLEDNHTEKLFDGVHIPLLCDIAAKYMA